MTTNAELFEALKYRVVVNPDTGTRIYYNHAGRLHREEGPAIEWSSGTMEWWQNGLRHRLDGPAIEYANGYQEWWLNGKRYTKQDYHAQLKALGHTV
jgi:hypothetical protein